MSLGPYIKVNPHELPSQYLSRVRLAGSEAGTKISSREAQEGNQLLTIWELEQFKRLTTLPAPQLTKEMRAIQEMQKLGAQNRASPLSVASVNIGIIAIALSFIGAAGGAFLLFASSRATDRIKKQNQLINTLLAKIKELEAEKARGTTIPKQFENKIQKIIRKAAQLR